MSNNANPENKTPNPGTKDALKAENDALKAENDAFKAELEALKAQKAELEALKAAAAKTQQAVPNVTEVERVDLFVPRGNDDDPNLVIAVNGVIFLLPRGKTSKVPKYIADEYYRAQAAQGVMDDHIDQMQKQANKTV